MSVAARPEVRPDPSQALLDWKTDAVRVEDETAQRAFVLQYVQPGLAGLMDGSVSTLAPLFAAAFATHNTWQTFLVGIAASVGAGISMAFAEALSDDGALTGRGRPVVRGSVTGAMTAIGGLGPYAPISHVRISRRDCYRRMCSRGRTRNHFLHPPSLHEYVIRIGGISGRDWWRARFSCRNSDR